VGRAAAWHGATVTAPDSRLTRLRRRLARAVEPGPDKGEAWCIGCSLSQGHTIVVSADGSQDHVQLHRGQDPAGHIMIKTAWAARQEEHPPGTVPR